MRGIIRPRHPSPLLSMTLAHRIAAFAAGAAILGAAATATATATPTVRFHLELTKSDPKAKDSLAAAPKAITLWFTEAPELKVTSIKLTDAKNVAVALDSVRKAQASLGPTAKTAIT